LLYKQRTINPVVIRRTDDDGTKEKKVMKTNKNKILGNISKALLLSMAVFFTVGNVTQAKAATRKNDSTTVFTISGIIIDTDTKKPIMYASVFISNCNIGTVANGAGEFLLKIPLEKKTEKIGFSHLGYKTSLLDANSLKPSDNTVTLTPELVSLQEIIVRIEEPSNLIKMAINNIRKNYDRKASMVTGFYRETIQQNKKYVAIAEAVLEAYKAPYDNLFLDDKVKILIGRQGKDVKKMDTIVVKLQGGPITPFYLDIAKNHENLVNEDFFKNYDLKLAGQVSLDNERCYVIEFEQRKDVNLPLYKGKFFLEVESLAFVAVEYSLSEYGLDVASSTFVKKKPLTMRIDITGADYYIKYTKSDDKWNLNYVRSELRFKCKWKKRFFSSSYVTMSEMAVTDINKENVEKIKYAEMVKQSDVFSEKAEAFRNDEFWGDYNIIVPEESILSAIHKLNKKLKKQ
jgi:hypothetical protein